MSQRKVYTMLIAFKVIKILSSHMQLEHTLHVHDKQHCHCACCIYYTFYNYHCQHSDSIM